MNQIKAQIQRERDTEKVSERGVLGSMGMRIGANEQANEAESLSRLLLEASKPASILK